MADINNSTTLPAQAGQQLGGSGTYFFKGYITAEEYSIDLQGKYGLQVYDVMRKSDPTVRAALNIVKWPILGAEWSIEPASNDQADQDIAKRANYEFFNRSISFHEVQRENLNFLEMGFAIAEEVWEVAEFKGRPYIGLKSLSSRKQRSIMKWQMDDGKDGVTQILPSGKYVDIPREKLFVVVNDQEGENYFGFPLLRYAYKPWKIKDGLEIMNAVALENMALGIPFIKKMTQVGNIDEGELQKLRDRLRQQRVNEEAFLEYPDTVEVGWTDMKGNTTKDVLPTIEYQDRQILLSVLGQFLLLGQNGSSGSRAVSADHSRLFVKALNAVAKQYQYAFQKDVINRWVDFNYSNLPNGYPKLNFSTISDEDVQETANAVNSLMAVSALHPDRDMENRLRKMLNMPPLTDEDYDNYDKNITAAQLKPDPNDPNAIQVQAKKDKSLINTPDKTSSNPSNPDTKDLPTATGNGTPNKLTAEAIAQAKAVQKRLLHLWADADLSNARA
jgi:hypothetical protein